MSEENLPITCSCGEVGMARVTRSWFVDEPAELARLVKGDFNRYKCARCGYTSSLSAEILVIHDKADWVLHLAPDVTSLASVSAGLRQHFPNARARIVATRLELMEKARALAAGLDDVALAIAKQLRSATLSEADRACTLWFDHVEEHQLVFVAIDKTGVRGTVNVPRDVFEKIKVAHATATHRQQLIVDSQFAQKLIDDARKPS